MHKMINKYLIIAAFIALGGVMACENDPFYYQDTPRVRLVGPSEWTLDTDSIVFSFAAYSSTLADTTFNVTVYIMGDAVDYDRTAAFEVNTSATTASASLYSFSSTATIPAGAYYATLPITIARDETLEEASVGLQVDVAANDDFQIGADYDHILIRWSAILTKPANWDDLEEFFGTYSQVKYQFIIDVLNIATFDTDALTWAELKNYQILLAAALDEYNDANPADPLTDENGNLVTF